jgi:hypothetical protein
VSYKRFGLLLPLSLGYMLDASAAGWEEKFYNPMPDAADVVLPMPCEGSMVFRKVFIPWPGRSMTTRSTLVRTARNMATSNRPDRRSSPAVSLARRTTNPATT